MFQRLYVFDRRQYASPSTMIALLDETTPEDGRGVFYVVSAAVCLAEPDEARHDLGQLVAKRTRTFHWAEEGPAARAALCELVETLGVISHVWVHHPTGRRHQERIRQRALVEVLPLLEREGVAELIIETRGARADARDRGSVLDALRSTTWKPAYRWAPKSEPLLWIADALCGAVREHLTEHDQYWFDRLRASGVIPDPLTYRSAL